MGPELGRRADDAIRAKLRLARSTDEAGRLKSRTIAEDMAIPVSDVPQILAGLVRAGIAESVAGPDGGYRLAALAATTFADLVVIDARLEAGTFTVPPELQAGRRAARNDLVASGQGRTA